MKILHPRIEILTPNSTKFIDLSRWVAALLVAMDHVRHGILANNTNIENPNILLKILYFATSFGHSAVMVFFILSGFLVGGLTVIKSENYEFKFHDYFIKRFSRIYTVLVPALVVGGFVDLIGSSFFDAQQIYSKANSGGIAILPFSAVDRLGSLNFLDNIFLLQFNGTFGSNGPLWSLAYEWWYYIIFGSFMVIITGSIKFRIISIFVFLLCLIILPFNLLLWGVVWLLGVATALFASVCKRRPPLWIALFIAAITIPAPRISFLTGNLHPFLIDMITAVGFSILLLSACRQNGIFTRLGLLNTKFADFSYSLYLFHFPILIISMGVLSSVFEMNLLVQPTLKNVGISLIVLFIVIGAAYGFSLFTEKNTARVRRWLERATGAPSAKLGESGALSKPGGVSSSGRQ